MLRIRVMFTLALALGVSWTTARAQSNFGFAAQDKKAAPPVLKPNEHLKGGVTSPFGAGAGGQFHTPVGPAGSRANVFDAPKTPYALQRQQQQQTPGLWQRFKNFLGLGDPPAPGTVPPQVPPGSLDPRLFGGR